MAVFGWAKVTAATTILQYFADRFTATAVAAAVTLVQAKGAIDVDWFFLSWDIEDINLHLEPHD